MYGYLVLLSFFAFIIYTNTIQTFNSISALLIFMIVVIVLGFLEKQQQKKKRMSLQEKFLKECIYLLFVALICIIPTFIYENPFPDLTDPKFLIIFAVAVLGSIAADAVQYMFTKEDSG
ncbi:hypothetical protein [Salinicoccus sp. HZC-1]|uniref:hypothetical protein n=1 Tax=Salinicoccus sp. HZC-1 TaxID=3385497 RepID=UPI00398B65A0